MEKNCREAEAQRSRGKNATKEKSRTEGMIIAGNIQNFLINYHN